VLLHTGLANPGVAAVVRRYARAWARSPVPVIVHVAGTTPEATASCCRRLSGVAAVAGVELGLPDTIDIPAAPAGQAAEAGLHHHDGAGRGLAAAIDDLTTIIRAAHAATVQPLIVRLPLVWADALCEPAVEAGADALTVAAPPRGTGWHAPSERFVTGRLYGPFVLGLALRALRRVAERVSVPLIGCGGIHSVADALTFLRAGATAVQVGGALWRDPASLARIARGLSPAVEPG
jgi:dihydroorotate dehydrogenase (NAD+) catalytic subunit